jgi:hypothetical protein
MPMLLAAAFSKFKAKDYGYKFIITHYQNINPQDLSSNTTQLAALD